MFWRTREDVFLRLQLEPFNKTRVEIEGLTDAAIEGLLRTAHEQNERLQEEMGRTSSSHGASDPADPGDALRAMLAKGAYPSFEAVDDYNGSIVCEWTRMAPEQKRAEYERHKAEWEHLYKGGKG